MDSKDIITIDLNDLNLDQYNTMDSDSWISVSTTSSFEIFDYNIIPWVDEFDEFNEWREITAASENNKALQKAIERVKILYYLSKEDGNSET